MDLGEGGYTLQYDSTKKIIFQLKLTDSALRIIEEYQDKKSLFAKPSINFGSNQGSISIPCGKDTECQEFTFQFSSLNPSSAIDCLQQTRTREGGRISVLGAIQHKITVNANEDSYDATRKRMTRVKELEQQTSTKVIKQPGEKKGSSKMRRVHQTSFTNPRNSTPPPSQRFSSSLSFNRSSSPLTSVTHRPESPVTNSPDLAGMRNKTKPVLSSNFSSTQVSSTRQKSQLEEILINILAVKSHRLQDLSLILAQHSISFDKQKISGILQHICTTRLVGMGDTEYMLNKNLYSDAHVDWPGYTEDERNRLKRKLAELVISSSDRKRPLSSGDAKPIKDITAASPSKRDTEAIYTDPVKKKARISLYNGAARARSVSPLDSTIVPPPSTSSKSTISSSSVIELGQTDFIDSLKPSSRTSFGSTSEKEAPTNSGERPAKNLAKAPAPVSRSKKHGKTTSESDKNRPLQPPAAVDRSPVKDTRNKPTESEAEEYVRKYKPISFSDQRNQYKNDFYAEYKEYLRLHEKVAVHAKKFREWQKQINDLPKGTDKYKKIAREVFDEYQKLKQDSVYRKDRERVSYLHRKLKHIKNLVLDFDRRESR